MTIINQITSFKISGFTYNGTDTQLNYTAGVASGTAQPSKALVLDAGSNINSINTMTLTNLNTTTLSINGTVITSGMIANLTSLDGAIAGTGVANKVLILDSNRDINNIRNLNATTLTGTLQTATQPNITSIGTLSSLTLSGALSGVTTIGASGIVSITNTTISTNTTTGALVVSGGIGIAGAVNIGNNLSVTGGLSMTGANRFITMRNSGLTNGQNVSFVLGRSAASNEQGEITFTYSTTVGSSMLSLGHWGGVVLNVFSSGNVSIGTTNNTYKLDVNGSLNSTSLYLGGSEITATASELNYVDTTAGTAEASKAIILDSNRDITNIRNLTATNLTATNLTGTLQTSSQPNITSVGTLTSLSLSGNITGATTINASGVVSITNTTTSTSSSTGALIVAGGAGLNHVVIGGNRTLSAWGLTGPLFNTTANTFIDSTSPANNSVFSPFAINSFQQSTLAASNVNVTYTQPMTNVFIANGPIAGTNSTIKTRCALLTGGAIAINPNSLSVSEWNSALIHFKSGTNTTTINDTGSSNIAGTIATNDFNGVIYTSSTAGRTMSRAATINISGAPSAGTNMTITNRHALYIANGNTTLADTTTSTNTTTGALVVTGGVGIGGAAYIGGGLVVTGNIIGTVATNNQPNITTLSGVTSIGASNTTTITGILQTAAQTNITSVGTLTGLTSSGVVSITNTTASSSISTGALTVSGGVGITGALNIGNTLSVSGNINTPLSIASTTKTIGGVYSVDGLIWNTIDDRLFGMRISAADTLALCWAGGGSYSDRILFSNNLTPVGGGAGTQFNTKVYINNTTTSTNTTSGALVIIGGIGIGGATNIGGALSVTGNITGTLATANQSNITSVGTLTGLTSSGVVSITNTTASTNTTTGALTISGGVGISGATNIGGALSVTGNITGTLATANQTNITSVGTLTGLTSSGIVSITNTTASTNTTSGALVVSGGVGIGGVINTTNTISTTQSVGDGFVHNAVGTNAITLKSNINTANTWAQFGTSSNHELRFMTNSVARLNISNAGAISIPGAVSITTSGSLNVNGATTLNNLAISGSRPLAAWGIAGPLFRTITATLTDTSTPANGDAFWLAANTFERPTFAANNTNVTVGTGAVNLYINGPPSEGTNMRFTKSYALYVNGNMHIGASKSIRDWNMGIQLRTFGSIVTDEITAASGTISTFGRTYEFDRSTFAATNTNVTLTNAATVYINDAPLEGTNMTITNRHALYIANGKTTLADTTASTSSTTGALTVSGGVGIGGATNIGGIVSITNTTASTNTSSGALIVSGGVGIGGATNIGGIISITNTTASTNTSSGALKVSGGVGIGGATNIGGILNIEAPISITPATKSIAGTSVAGVIWHTNQDRYFGMRQIDANNLALCWSGGGTYNDKIIFNEPSGTTFTTAINITNTTASTSSTTGALTVAGGVGVTNNINAGGNITTTGGNIILNQSNKIIFTRGPLDESDVNSTIYSDDTSSLILNSSRGGGEVKIYTNASAGSPNNFIINNNLSAVPPFSGTNQLTINGITNRIGIFQNTPSYVLDVNGTLGVSGITTITNTTASSSTSTGALIVSGGIGISGSIYASGSINIGGTSNFLQSGSSSKAQYVGNWQSASYWGIGPHDTTTQTVRIGICTNTTGTWATSGTIYPAVTGGAYSTPSDYRLKNTINLLDSCLYKILKLNPVSYYLNSDINKENLQVGFIAHELQENFPEVVNGIKDQIDINGNDIHQSVNYAQMTSILVKGMQEQQKLMSQLQNENKELKNKIINLENTLTNILERISNLEN